MPLSRPFKYSLARALIAAALFSGCAVNPRPNFDETNASVKARTGLETKWMRSSLEAEAALARAREMLKEDLTPRRSAQIALLNNRDLQARLEELGVAQANLSAASLPGNPEIEGFLGWPGDGGARKIDVGFGLDVLDLLVLPSRKRLARLELDQAKSLAGEEILKMAARAQTETYALQALEASAASVTTAVEIEEALAEFAEARARAGALSDLALEEERLHLDELRATRETLRLNARRQREVVNTVLGLAEDDRSWRPAPLSADLPETDPPLMGLEAMALEQRFDLLALRAAIELLESSLGLQKKTRLLPAGVHVGARLEKEGNARVAGPTLRLQLPIFNSGRAESARLEALYFQATRTLEDHEIRARADVRQKTDALATSRELVRHYEEVVAPRKKRIVEMKKGYYNMMLAGADDLLRAKRDEVESELPLIDARRAYWIARTELAHALGGALPETLAGEKK